MIRITKITEKYSNLVFEEAQEVTEPAAETPAETPAEGETAETTPTDSTEQPAETSEYLAGDIVVYIFKGKTMDDWNALTDEQKTNLEESPASDVVNVKKIEKIEGDKVYFKDQSGEEFTKNLSDIVQKQAPTQGAAEETAGETPVESTETPVESDQAQNVKEGLNSDDDILTFGMFFKK
jgi:hypothetical protein